MNTDIEIVTGALAEFDRVDSGLASLSATYASVVFDVATSKGMDAAKAARAAIREPRYQVEKVRKGAKAPLLAIGKKIDSEAARITARLLELEDPIDLQIKTEESRKEAERQAKIEAERLRVANIQERIAEIRGAVTAAANSPSALILEHRGDIERMTIDESFAELQASAEAAKAETMAALDDLHAKALAREEESRRIVAERAELERLRREDAERQAAAEAERRREQAEIDAHNAAERARIAEEDRAARAAREAEAAAHREVMAAEQARLAAERAEIERQRAPVPPPPMQPPTSDEIVAVLAAHYGVSLAVVRVWLRSFPEFDA